MTLARALLFAASILMITGSAQAQNPPVGGKDSDGRTFLFDETLEHPFSNAWSGIRISGNGSGQTDVHIKSDGKTVFEGTLSINCDSASGHFWTSNESEAAETVPFEVISNARRHFCVRQAAPVPTCPSGYVLSGGQCIRQAAPAPTCPSGYVFSGGQCVSNTTPTPTPQADFQILDGYDLFGADYASVPGRVHYDDCEYECKNDRRCRAFTYNTRARKCFLKSYVPRRSRFQDAISGIKQ